MEVGGGDGHGRRHLACFLGNPAEGGGVFAARAPWGLFLGTGGPPPPAGALSLRFQPQASLWLHWGPWGAMIPECLWVLPDPQSWVHMGTARPAPGSSGPCLAGPCPQSPSDHHQPLLQTGPGEDSRPLSARGTFPRPNPDTPGRSGKPGSASAVGIPSLSSVCPPSVCSLSAPGNTNAGTAPSVPGHSV